jgi:hypothetical protein
MRKTISPKAIYHLAVEFEKVTKTTKRRGRPQTYSFALILTMASLQNLYNLSFREVIEFTSDMFNETPCLSTFHYRVDTLHAEIIQEFITFLGLKLQNHFVTRGKTLKRFIIDGTGFSYNDAYPLSFLRGTEVRKVKSHVRALALVATTGKERFFIGAQEGRAYASEVKMAERLLPKFTFKKLPFLGDKGFDAIHVLQMIKQQGAIPAIRMKETWRVGIKDKERVKSKRNEERYGRKRTLIEGLFGNLKQKVTSHIRVFKEHIAQVYALLRLALYNVYLLTSSKGVWVFFEQLQRPTYTPFAQNPLPY